MGQKTKQEIEKENKQLRQEIKDLKSRITEIRGQQDKAEKDAENMNRDAITIAKVDGIYKFVEIKYDLDTLQGVVTKVEDAARNNIDYSNAYARLSKEVDKLMEKVAKDV